MTFGFSTTSDALSWAVAFSLALKLMATVILLARPAATRLATRDGRLLWWATKITPVIAAPCLVALAWLDGDRVELWAYSLLTLFVLVAVPLAITRRRHGSLGRQFISALRAPHTPSPRSPPPR